MENTVADVPLYSACQKITVFSVVSFKNSLVVVGKADIEDD